MNPWDGRNGFLEKQCVRVSFPSLSHLHWFSEWSFFSPAFAPWGFDITNGNLVERRVPSPSWTGFAVNWVGRFQQCWTTFSTSNATPKLLIHLTGWSARTHPLMRPSISPRIHQPCETLNATIVCSMNGIIVEPPTKDSNVHANVGIHCKQNRCQCHWHSRPDVISIKPNSRKNDVIFEREPLVWTSDGFIRFCDFANFATGKTIQFNVWADNLRWTNHFPLDFQCSFQHCRSLQFQQWLVYIIELAMALAFLQDGICPVDFLFFIFWELCTCVCVCVYVCVS